MKSIQGVGLGAALVIASVPTIADAATQDTQGWGSVTVSGKVADGVLASGELIGRMTDDAGRLGQIELRAHVGHAISKSVTVWIGYVHVVNYAKTGRDGIEEQFMQQLNWNIGKVLGASLSSRTRLEQRFQRGVDDTAWRFREQVKLAVPLARFGPNAVIWVETFVSLNRTSAVRPGIDQVRSFAGLGFKLSKHADLEAGYLNQYLNRPNGDFSNHALSLSLGYKF